MQLLEQTSLPKGVVNMVHGGKPTVDRILSHPDVKAISFVGSTTVGKYIYEEGTRHGKRVQSNAGAKNHCIIMPDYPLEQAVNAIVGASFGASGQRCMALSVAIVVGEADKMIQMVVDAAKTLKVGPGKENPDLGPMIEPGQVQKITNWLDESQQKGAKVNSETR
jgi:malonate-semialdehyde dehydrogenase (acetylating)/methylmalonate-semialdehyde dehydrogenase